MTRTERRLYALAVNRTNLAIITVMYPLTVVAVCVGLAL